MRIVKFAAVLGVTLSVTLSLVSSAAELAALSGKPPAEWTAFRQRYPHHIQGVALSEPRADRSRVLIVAEPPPDVTLDGLTAVSPELLGKRQVFKQTIGHDGWVKDVVFEVPPSDAAALSSLCSRLNRVLFRTSYKAYVLDIPVAGKKWTPPSGLALDFRVSAGELKRWLLTDAPALLGSRGGAATTLDKLLAMGTSGVYFSEQPGLVVWTFGKDSDLTKSKAVIRRFVLDSDLVLGAIAGAKGIAIVARERSLPVTVMPPLRVETILLLASAKTWELAQSYERNNIFAGRFDATRDWAPIYLSPQLIDTEYGSLLNITDQLLKSWSNNGLTSYANFLYPDPRRWPFAKPLPNELDTHEVTYNWNTKGAGYRVDLAPYALLALNRTGALPVSYIPGDGPGASATMTAEDTAYAYFADMSDPNLARVVQYAGLYQAFTNLREQAIKEPDGERLQQVNEILFEEAKRIIANLVAFDGVTLEKRAQDITAQRPDSEIEIVWRAVRQARGEKDVPERLTAPEVAEGRKLLAQVTAKFITQMRDEFRQLRDTESAKVFSDAIRAFTAFGGSGQTVRFAQIMRGMTDVNALKNRMVADASTRVGGWIHTPAIVVSWNRGELAEGRGGHNLGAKVSGFRADRSLASGELKIETTAPGQARLIFSEQDLERLGPIVRDVGRYSDDIKKQLPSIRKMLQDARPPTPKTARVALAVKPEISELSRGLQKSDLPAVSGIRTGWSSRIGTAGESAELAEFGATPEQFIVKIRRDGDGFVMLTPQARGARAEVFSTIDECNEFTNNLLSAKAHPDGVIFELSNLSETEAHNFRLTMEAQARGADAGKFSLVKPGGKANPRAAAETLRTRFDFSKATVEKLPSRADAAGRIEHVWEIKAPAMEVGKPGLLMRVRLFFEGLVPPQFLAKLDSAIQAIFGKLGANARIADVDFALRQEVRALSKDLPPNIRNHILLETDQIHLGANTPPGRLHESGYRAG